ncbi:hypothetical protein [Brevibacillus choshinensis]|uniref:hypothetical protein n=1 Tax=Brevibacillus choshinensis TaxID=54911 RepID=UPI000B2F682D|nr:hypothetical protein [Brevibacillus choshinensis]
MTTATVIDRESSIITDTEMRSVDSHSCLRGFQNQLLDNMEATALLYEELQALKGGSSE